LDLRITESGAEHPQLLIFIHGGGVSGWMWEEQISDFQRFHYPCIAAGSANAV
jgi:hypothetical protein